MIYILIALIIVLLIALKVQRDRNLKEQINWITEIVASDGYVSNNERDKIKEFATNKKIPSEQVTLIFESIETAASKIKPEVEAINWNRRNGLDFEKFIAKIATQQDVHSSYEVESWRGDKYVDGCYDKSNCDPDLIILVKLSHTNRRFALECKWRKDFDSNDFVQIAEPYQLRHYRECQKEWGFPVFIVLGIGGEGCTPQQIYLIPLDEIKDCKIRKEWMQKFQRENFSKKLFFDVNTLSLS